jgi:hypothetical protein
VRSSKKLGKEEEVEEDWMLGRSWVASAVSTEHA